MNPAICTTCRQPIPGGAPEGACPRCLVKLAVEVGSAGSSLSSPFQPPSAAALDALFDDLEVLSLIGAGGMGAVYRARQRRLDRLVALKILPPERAGDPIFAARFLREAQALAKLRHPHIIGVYDAGQAGEYLYIVLEYVDGISLRNLLAAGRPGAGETLRLTPQICAALQFAHEAGVVHRDIKPENVLVDAHGQIKIADFGLAKLASRDAAENISLTDPRACIGTVRYMAPEQFASTAAVDSRADIYSLGVLFYELLTGDLPTPDFKPPSQRTAVDARFDRVIERCLKNSPDERYQQVVEIQRDVERISTSASRRKRMAAALTLAVISVFVGLLTWNEVVRHRGENVQIRPSPRDPPVRPFEEMSSARLLTSPDWEWTQPECLELAGGPRKDAGGPAVSGDELLLIFTSSTIVDEGGTSLEQLWQTRRTSRDEPFGKPERLPDDVNGNAPNFQPFLSADGLTLMFSSPREGTHGAMDLWSSTRASFDAPWSRPENVGPDVNSPNSEWDPALSADGLTLCFSLLEHGPDKSADIYLARRTSQNRRFGTPAIVGGINDPSATEGGPSLSSDGLSLVFYRYAQGDRPRLHVATRSSTSQEFGRVEPLEFPPYAGRAETQPTLSADGRTLYFVAASPSRPGAGDIWLSHRVPKTKTPK